MCYICSQNKFGVGPALWDEGYLGTSPFQPRRNDTQQRGTDRIKIEPF